MAWKRHAADNGYKVQVFAASMTDINKTLRMKEHNDFQKKLSKHFHHYLQTFSYKAVNQLPPLHSNSTDHKIELIPDENNKAPNVFYNLLYQISRKELLIL